MLIRLAAAAVLAAFPACAQSTPVSLKYEAYSHGFNVVDLQTTMDIAPTTYRVSLSFHLVGLIGTLMHADSQTTVDGRFNGNTAAPRELFSSGHMHGDPRVTQIDWRGGQPTITQLIPTVEEDRDPVPLSDQLNTIDTLSAMAELLRDVATNNRCDLSSRTFDGRRLSIITARTVGQETLEPTSRSSFHGPALRCDFEGRQLAGFVHDADVETLKRPQHGTAWFASVTPGGPPVPVRITFQTRAFGDATMYVVAP